MVRKKACCHVPQNRLSCVIGDHWRVSPLGLADQTHIWSNLSINQLKKSLLSRDFAASCRISLKPIPCIIVRIDGVSAVVIKDLMIEGEHRATCECTVLFAYKCNKVR
jgi:hypothetical protein